MGTKEIKIDRSPIKQIMKDKFAVTAFVILIIMYLIIAFADFFAVYKEDFSDRNMSYAPPSKLYVITPENKLSKPYTYNYTREFNPKTFSNDFKTNRSNRYYLKLFGHGFEYKVFGIIKTDRHLFALDNPDGRLYLLGADINGRDNYSRLLYGGQISLTIGFLALFISFPLGLLYGGISGYFGGVLDNIMMRIAEAIMSIPSFYLLIILAALLPANMTSTQRFTLIIVILAFIGWAGFARVVRGMVLSIKQQEFVESARSIGASSFRIITKHILPQTASYVLVAITLSVPGYILGESGLSFLGLGIQQPDASWGNMLKEAQEYTNILYRPWLLTPGYLIFVTILSFNLIGDTIRDVLDPKSYGR
ncbi:MAG: ABC transporter permease [Candidatus Gastranaerophilales bacterium]|nr:ABC transporter permease [Candidatus Gastranaerophilales bacterium]